MFDLNEYRKFVESRRTRFSKAKYKYNYIDAMCQFTEAPSTYLKCDKDSVITFFKRNFNELEKPAGVYYNTWFLYLYGYKCCFLCKSIYPLDNFNKNSDAWDKLTTYCKECEKQRKNKYDIAEMSRQYRKNNPDKIYADTAFRRAQRKRATPKCLTDSQKKEILSVYQMCREKTKTLGISHHVDHIVPLTHDLVCGLHVVANLQILTAEENMSKKNKFEVI